MRSVRTFILSFCLFWVCLVLMTGCAQNRQTIARLEQENAQQRERIWQSNRKMEDFRQENLALRQQLAALQGQDRSNAPVSQPQTQLQSPPQSSIIQSSPGSGRIDRSAVAPTPQPSTLGTPTTPQALPINPPAGSQAEVAGVPHRTIRVRKTDSSAVHSVSILADKAKPIHYEGLHAEIQLKDANGGIVLAPAPLYVMVTDPSKPADQARISKWRYTAEDLAAIINSGQAAISIPLNMAWERACPENLDLELHILYHTSDQRILSHRARIDLAQSTVPQSAVSAAAGQAVGASVSVPSGVNGNAASGNSPASSGSPYSRPVWTPEP
ncbi:MAG: hypothetical protein E7029_12825 [Planctomycetaceae bacterium]|nr:hypothetical protein [Planctomycetaceae bacterium]